MMRFLRACGLSCLLGLLFLSIVSRLTAQGPAAGESPFAGAPFALSSADLKIASDAVPVTKEYPAEILYEEGIYRIGVDGTLKYQHRLIYRVDGESAVKGWAEVSTAWDPWFENQAQIHARVLQPNGVFVELDQKTITDAPVKAEDSETFSSQHVRRAPLPGMAVGCIVEETENLDENTPYFAGGALYRFAFRENVPSGRTRLVVELPSGTPYKDLTHEVPGLSVSRTEADGTRRIVY